MSAPSILDGVSRDDDASGIGTWCGDLELSGDHEPRSVASPNAGQDNARILVRLHGEPLGYVTCRAIGGTIDLDALLRVSWERFGTRINDHLKAEGLSPIEELLPYARPAGRGDRCPNQAASEVLVTVVVCTRDRSELLAGCLDRLRRLTHRPAEFIIVDNAPSDHSSRNAVDHVSATDPRFRYVMEPRPGLSHARNRGLAEARGRYVAYTDDDVSVDPEWIQGLLRGFQRREDVGCVTGLVCTAGITSEAEAYFDARAAAWSTHFESRVFDRDGEDEGPLYPYAGGRFGTGANFAFDRPFLARVGGFDEALGAGSLTRGGEDLDIFVRVLADSRAIVYEPAALVWHHHRADHPALLDQMYGYGTGLSAFITKCLMRPESRLDVLRRVPAGLLRALRIGTETDQRLAGRVDVPAGVHGRELAGWLAGPLLYLRSRWAEPVPAQRESGARTATARLAISVMTLVCFVTGAMAFAVGADLVRTVSLILFTLIGIGSAPWQANAELLLPARLTLTMLTSFAVLILVSVPMVMLQQWRPMLAFVAVSAVCIPLHLSAVRLALRDADGALARVTTWTDASVVAIRAVRRFLGTPANLLAVTGALLSLTAALMHRHLTPGFYGFLPDIGPAWYAGLGLILVALVLPRGRDERAVMVPVLLLLLVLTLTPALVYDGPRSQSAAKHVDLVMQIRSVHEMRSTVEIYNAWNGFFSGMAWLCDIVGIRDPMRLATFWPPLLSVFRLVALRYFFAAVLPRPRQAWIAVALAVLADPLGADYFSPQSVGFVVGIAVFGVALTVDEKVPRLLMILVSGCLLAVTHQLSPYGIGGALLVLVVFHQLRPVWTPMLILGPALGWAALNRGALTGFVDIRSMGRLHNFRPPVTVGSMGLDRLPIVGETVRALLVIIAVVGAVAFVVLMRHRRDARFWAMACCPAVGLVLVAVNPYGQEGIFRAVLFGMPWLAALAAHAFAPDRGTGRRLAHRAALMGMVATLAAAHLVAAFGLDAVNVIRPGDVVAFRFFQEQRTERSGQHYLLALGTGDLPTSLPTTTGHYQAIRRENLGEPVRQEPSLNSDLQMQTLTVRLISYTRGAAGPTANTTLFALWSPVSSQYGWAYGVQTPDQFAALRDAFRRAPYWEVVVQKGGTYLFRFDPTRYPGVVR